MALRIGGGKREAAPVEEPEAQEPPMEEQTEAPEEESQEGPHDEQAMGTGQLDPAVAGYKGPDQGPFMCSNCLHYGVNGANTCQVVSGDIDEMGVCNVFTSAGAAQQPDEGEQPEAPPEEAPMEEEQPPQGA